MKTITSALTLSKPMLSLVYFAATGIFLVGLQSYLLARYQVDLFGQALTHLPQAYGFAHRLIGWTIYGFLPLGALLLFYSWTRGFLGPLSPKAKHVCELIEVLAYALGILGAISRHILPAGSGSSGDLGLGSLSLGIIFWVWSVVLCFDFERFRAAETE